MSLKSKKRLGAFTALLVALALGLFITSRADATPMKATAATVAAPATSTHGVQPDGSLILCINTKSHVYQVLMSGTACKAGFWTVTAGPKGATGAKGATGPTGAKGDAGAKGDDGADAHFTTVKAAALSDATTLDTIGGPIKTGAKAITDSVTLPAGTYSYTLYADLDDTRAADTTDAKVTGAVFLERDLGLAGYDWTNGEALGNTVQTAQLVPGGYIESSANGSGTFTLSEETTVFLGAGGYAADRSSAGSGKVVVHGASATFIRLS